MPRTVRRLSENNLYHIVIKGNNSEDLFFNDSDNLFFLKEFKRACIDYDAEIITYCLMRNHVHLLMRFSDNNTMSPLFKSFGASYCYKYNRHHNRTGRLFNSRFYSKPINDDEYLFSVVKYIHYNPVNAGICATPKDYKWSGYNEYYCDGLGFADTGFLKNLLSKNEFEMLHIRREEDLFSFFIIANSIEKVNDEQLTAFYEEIRKSYSLNEAIMKMKSAGISIFPEIDVRNVNRGLSPIYIEDKGDSRRMKEFNITVLKGDGIGPEIVDEAIKVLNKAGEKFGFMFNYNYQLLGGCAIDETGVPYPQATADACKASDAVLLGAVGGPKWDSQPGSNRPEKGLLAIREDLGLFANLRPAKIFAPLKSASPIKEEIIGEGLDILIVRELTGGIYFGDRGTYEENGVVGAYDTERYTYPEIKRIVVAGFEYAMKRDKRLTCVDKANVLDSSRLWRKVMEETAKDYPEVEVSYMYVDNCAMQLVRNPNQFDTIVTSNIFGDILSDEASMISGSIGMLASASLAEGTFGLYEPIHGSAPDIAGQGKANPLATILSGAMMLRYTFGESEAADAIEKAVDKALTKARTPDIFEEGFEAVSTSQMGDIVVSLL